MKKTAESLRAKAKVHQDKAKELLKEAEKLEAQEASVLVSFCPTGRKSPAD